MDNLILINKDTKNCTRCGDVIRLLKVEGQSRTFSLYKTWKIDLENSYHQQATYFILEEGDPFPVVITEKMARKILKNPEMGIAVVAYHWPR